MTFHRRPTAPSRACPLLPALCHTQDLGASSALAILLSGRRLGHRPPGRGQVRPATPSPAPRASTARRSPVPGAFPDFTDGRSLRSHAPPPPRRHGPESSAGQAHTPVPRSHGCLRSTIDSFVSGKKRLFMKRLLEPMGGALHRFLIFSRFSGHSLSKSRPSLRDAFFNGPRKHAPCPQRFPCGERAGVRHRMGPAPGRPARQGTSLWLRCHPVKPSVTWPTSGSVE